MKKTLTIVVEENATGNVTGVRINKNPILSASQEKTLNIALEKTLISQPNRTFLEKPLKEIITDYSFIDSFDDDYFGYVFYPEPFVEVKIGIAFANPYKIILKCTDRTNGKRERLIYTGILPENKDKKVDLCFFKQLLLNYKKVGCI